MEVLTRVQVCVCESLILSWECGDVENRLGDCVHCSVNRLQVVVFNICCSQMIISALLLCNEEKVDSSFVPLLVVLLA